MRVLFIWLSMLMVLTACTETPYLNRVSYNWQGQPASKLVEHWGQPDLLVQNTDGHKLYGYVTSVIPPFQQPAGVPYAISAPRGGKPVLVSVQPDTHNGLAQLKCETWFEINRQDTIVATQAKGVRCPDNPPVP